MQLNRLLIILIAIFSLAIACNEKKEPQPQTKPAASNGLASGKRQAEAKPKAPEPTPTATTSAEPPTTIPAAIEPKPTLLETFKISRPKGVEFVKREDWSKTEILVDALERMDHAKNDPIMFIVIMHSGVLTTPDNELAQVRSIEGAHMGPRGWADISAHYLIGPSGKVYEGRPLAYRADGTVGSGMGNDSHLWGKCAVMMLGNFNSGEQEFTSDAQDALTGLTEERKEAFNGRFEAELQEYKAILEAKLGPNKEQAEGRDKVQIRIHPILAQSPIREYLEGEQQPAGTQEEVL